MTEQKTIIHFIRHSIVHNPQEIFYGCLPGFGLSKAGEELALSQAQKLKQRNIQQFYASPLLRARQTAQLMARELGVKDKIQISKRLIEVKSPYDGQPLRLMEQKKWDIYTGNQKPFEQPADINHRMLMFIRRILTTRPGSELAAVTHADNIVFLLLWLHQKPITYESKRSIEMKEIQIDFPTPASITSFVWDQPNVIKNVRLLNADE